MLHAGVHVWSVRCFSRNTCSSITLRKSAFRRNISEIGDKLLVLVNPKDCPAAAVGDTRRPECSIPLQSGLRIGRGNMKRQDNSFGRNSFTDRRLPVLRWYGLIALVRKFVDLVPDHSQKFRNYEDASVEIVSVEGGWRFQ